MAMRLITLTILIEPAGPEGDHCIRAETRVNGSLSDITHSGPWASSDVHAIWFNAVRDRQRLEPGAAIHFHPHNSFEAVISFVSA